MDYYAWISEYYSNCEANWLEAFFTFTSCSSIFLAFVFTYGELYFPLWFCHLLKYGRANESTSKAQIIRRLEVPKSWFAHFYIYAVCAQIYVLSTLLAVYTSPEVEQKASRSTLGQVLGIVGGKNRQQTVDATTTVLVSSLFLAQVIRRLYENWFVSIFSSTKMNVLHYVLALLHYTGCILAIVAHSPGFSVASSIEPQCAKILCYNKVTVMHWVGILIFLYGTYQQNKVHHQYADLRRGKGKKVVSLGHHVPRGGWFEKVSCPNYFAEIIIYFSFCVLFSFANRTWNFIWVWVLLNQVTSALMCHLWYVKTFPDYPKDRKAIIPYLL